MAGPRSRRATTPDGPADRALLLEGLDAVLLADDGRRYVAANAAACELLGRPLDSVLALSVDDLAPPEARPWVADAWAQFIVDGTQAGSMVIERPDGSVRHVEFSATASVAPGLHRSVLRDVSDRVTAEVALRSAQEEAALQRIRADRTETQLLLALGQIPTVVYSQDVDLRYTFVSQARYGMATDLIGRTDAEVWPLAEDADRLTTLKLRVLATATRLDEELVLTYPAGPRICQVSIAPLLDADGRPVGITGATTDVTVLREAELSASRSRDELVAMVEARTRELSESRRLSDILFAELDVVTWVEDLRSGARTYVSPAIERIIGVSERDFFEEAKLLARVHADDRAVLARALAEPGSSDVEFRLLGSGGDGTPAWLRRRTSVVRDAGGEAALRYGIVLDVTAIREAEAARIRAVHESEALYRRLIERQEAFFWEEELPDHVMRYISPQATTITGYPMERWMHERWFWRSLIHPDDRERVIAAYEARPDAPLEYRFVHADGHPVWVREHATEVEDEPGRPSRLMGVVFDITALRAADEERRMLESRLEEVARLEALARVAATTAHDFGNVLLGIDVFSKQLAKEPGLGDRARTDVARIRSAVEQGRSAASSLVSLGRLADPELVPTDVHEALRGLELSIAGLLGSRIQLHYDLAAPHPVVDLDPGGLERALINIALNARDAISGPRGSVTIATREVEEDETVPTTVGIAYPGRYLSIGVTDTGDGMDARTLARAFEPYFTTKPVGKGTGLGLSSVHALVRGPDGHVHATSAPGAGTSFRICLPLAPAAAPAPATRPRRGRARGARSA